MAKVIAKERGYFGGVVREPGERFNVPDEIWNDEKRRPKWCADALFGGKGDHDGDGKAGGSLPKDEPDAKPTKGRGRKAKTVDAPTAEPFADAPEPQTLVEAQAAAGGIEPDWIPKEHQPQPVTD